MRYGRERKTNNANFLDNAKSAVLVVCKINTVTLTLLFKSSGGAKETGENKQEIREEDRPSNIHITVLLLRVTL